MKKIFKYLLRTILIVFILLNVMLIFHAYKLTHFYDRDEISVKPAAQKNTWEKTGDILFGINAVKQLNAAPDSAFETIYLYTSDSIKLEAWQMTLPAAKGTVILFHGHGSKKSAVLQESYAFRKMGYNTFLIDFRAHGGSGGNITTIGYKEAEDVKIAYDYIQKAGEKNIILWGISMGAASIAKAANDYSIFPSKIILEMPFGSLPDAVRGRLKMMHLPAEPLSAMLTFWGGTEHGFWAFGMKPGEYVKKINCPVLLQWGRNDPRVTEKETQEIYKNIPTAKKLVVYENSSHESLCIKENKKWVAEIAAFLAP